MTQNQNVSSQATISAQDISVLYANQKTLEVPSIQVLPREVLVIIGPNGSGKTTLVLCLALLMKATTGIISYQGETVRDRRQMLQIRRQLAVVFQESLLFNDSVWNNVTMGLKFRGVKKEQVKVRSQHWLERFGVAHLAKRQAKTLSGGEAKRVSLARAFALEPEVLFLDEPFEGLDSPTRKSLTSDFESVLRETKVSAVMVTHDRNEALILANRVAVIIGGKIRQIGTKDEVFNYPIDEEVAEFVEAGNIMQGNIIEQNNGMAIVSIGKQKIEVVSPLSVGTGVTACLRFEDVTLSIPAIKEASSSARNRFKGVITRVLPLAAQVRITLDCGFTLIALITKRSWEDMGLDIGQEVNATFKASSIHLIPHH
jgi:tungstate transport system ATP-binding protein